MIDCLLDWVDADDLHRLNGAEAGDNYRPPNTLLTRIEQLQKVRGWTQFVSLPGWDNDFTLNSTGPVDVLWASREVLLSLPGLSEALVDQFLTLRRGPDGADGTDDDAPFKSLSEVRSALGFTEEQFGQLAELIGFRDQTLRVVSVGKSGDVSRTVQMVIRKTGSLPQLITWKEL
jgi:general secretion pathway protein K